MIELLNKVKYYYSLYVRDSLCFWLMAINIAMALCVVYSFSGLYLRNLTVQEMQHQYRYSVCEGIYSTNETEEVENSIRYDKYIEYITLLQDIDTERCEVSFWTHVAGRSTGMRVYLDFSGFYSTELEEVLLNDLNEPGVYIGSGVESKTYLDKGTKKILIGDLALPVKGILRNTSPIYHDTKIVIPYNLFSEQQQTVILENLYEYCDHRVFYYLASDDELSLKEGEFFQRLNDDKAVYHEAFVYEVPEQLDVTVLVLQKISFVFLFISIVINSLFITVLWMMRYHSEIRVYKLWGISEGRFVLKVFYQVEKCVGVAIPMAVVLQHLFQRMGHESGKINNSMTRFHVGIIMLYIISLFFLIGLVSLIYASLFISKSKGGDSA